MPAAGQGSLSAGYWNPVSVSCPVTDLFSIFRQSYLSATPRTAMGNHQAAGSVPAPWEFHPPEDLSGLSPLVATAHGWLCRFNARLYGRTEVSLSPLPVIALPGAARQPWPAVSRSSPEGYRTQELFFEIECPLCRIRPVHRGAAAIVAYAHHNSNGKDLMDGYGIVKVQ